MKNHLGFWLGTSFHGPQIAGYQTNDVTPTGGPETGDDRRQRSPSSKSSPVRRTHSGKAGREESSTRPSRRSIPHSTSSRLSGRRPGSGSTSWSGFLRAIDAPILTSLSLLEKRVLPYRPASGGLCAAAGQYYASLSVSTGMVPSRLPSKYAVRLYMATWKPRKEMRRAPFTARNGACQVLREGGSLK